jgi:hypothetical protein
MAKLPWSTTAKTSARRELTFHPVRGWWRKAAERKTARKRRSPARPITAAV